MEILLDKNRFNDYDSHDVLLGLFRIFENPPPRKPDEPTFVYMILFESNDFVRLKVGITGHPYKRIQALLCQCPLIPRQILIRECRSKRQARAIEMALLSALNEWGDDCSEEWFDIPVKRKDDFNTKWRSAIRHYQLIDSACGDFTWNKRATSLLKAGVL